MTRRNEYIIAVAIAIICIAVFAWCHRRQDTPIPKKEQHTLDSLQITKPMYDSTQHALSAAETVYVTRVQTIVKEDTRITAKVDTLRTLADSLTAVAKSAGDTSTKLWGALRARTAEADTLLRQRDSLRVGLQDMTLAYANANSRATNAEGRLTVSETLNRKLADDVKRASECQFLWMRCPTRVEIAVASIATTFIATKYGGTIVNHVAVPKLP